MKIENIITSGARKDILALFYKSRSNKEFFLREIDRKLGIGINAVRREAANLEEGGVLVSRKDWEDGRKIFYRLSNDPGHRHLKALVLSKPKAK